MILTEALSGSRLACVERSVGGITVLIHRSRQGYHLTRYTPDESGHSQAQCWEFPTLYDLQVFARAQWFAEVDAEAIDWCADTGSP